MLNVCTSHGLLFFSFFFFHFSIVLLDNYLFFFLSRLVCELSSADYCVCKCCFLSDLFVVWWTVYYSIWIVMGKRLAEREARKKKYRMWQNVDGFLLLLLFFDWLKCVAICCQSQIEWQLMVIFCMMNALCECHWYRNEKNLLLYYVWNFGVCLYLCVWVAIQFWKSWGANVTVSCK